jgi:glycine/D-amino acid oxidase-like deaminating enzyme
LDGSVTADIAIVGAGYTGLWTAYYLLKHQPDLKVVVVESEVAGFGASGRNGGWCTAALALNSERAAASHGRQAVAAIRREMANTVDEIGKVSAEEGIDCHFHKGGNLVFATQPAHVPRLLDSVADAQSWWATEEDLRWLEPEEASGRARMSHNYGAVFTPHCAVIHPARLVRGLAKAVERKGGVIYEQTRATELRPGMVLTEHGTVKAGAVLRCTEAFTAELAGHRRELVPIYSLMIATEPLSASAWDEIGLADRETFEDGRHLIIYGQRTADGRIAFGGRGASYHWASSLRPAWEQDSKVHSNIRHVLGDLFPTLEKVDITHTWGGAVAVPRDWSAYARFDRSTGMGQVGGYVGVGVAASNLGGRTMADLVLSRDTDLVHLPWVGHRARGWEPEPLRWLGVNAGRSIVPFVDRREERTGKPAELLSWFLEKLTSGYG